MDVRFKARSLWKTGKELMVSCTKALSNGITFSQVFSVYAIYIRVIIPSAVDYFIDCLVAFFLFHFYLLYVLIFSFSLSIIKKFKVKGSGIAPMSGALKEKAGMFLTYFFVIQSISKWTVGMPTLDRLMGWAFQVKPQINFKPQIKIGKSKSAENLISVKNKVGTALHVGFESDDESTRKTIKKLKKAGKHVDFATDLADAMLGNDEEDLITEWLESEEHENFNSEEIKKHVQKLIAENDQLRRRSGMWKTDENENIEL